MAVDGPVVASAVGGLPEVIEHGRTGFLLQPDDLEGMSAAALTLLGDGRLHREISAAARHVVHTRFCEEKIVPLYERYYEEVIAQSLAERPR